MRILIANTDKVLAEYRNSYKRRCSIIKDFLKTFTNYTGKNLCWSLLLIKFIKKRLQHNCFLVKFAKYFTTPFWRKPVNDYFWEYFKRSYWTPPQGVCIWIKLYRLSKFSTLGSIFQHGTLQCIFIIYDSACKERTKQFSRSIKINWTKIHFYNLISLAYFYK